MKGESSLHPLERAILNDPDLKLFKEEFDRKYSVVGLLAEEEGTPFVSMQSKRLRRVPDEESIEEKVDLVREKEKEYFPHQVLVVLGILIYSGERWKYVISLAIIRLV